MGPDHMHLMVSACEEGLSSDHPLFAYLILMEPVRIFLVYLAAFWLFRGYA